MYLSGGFATSIAVVLDTDADSYEGPEPDELDEYLIDEFRTRFRRISSQRQEPQAVENALREAAEYLGGTLDAHTDAAGSTFALHVDPDIGRRELRDALELYLSPLGVDPASLLAGLDGIERLQARMNDALDHADERGAGGDVTQRVINIVVPAEGFTLTSNGDWHVEGAKAERERTRDAGRQAEISEHEAIKADRQKRLDELADRINRRLDEREAAKAAEAAADDADAAAREAAEAETIADAEAAREAAEAAAKAAEAEATRAAEAADKAAAEAKEAADFAAMVKAEASKEAEQARRAREAAEAAHASASSATRAALTLSRRWEDVVYEAMESLGGHSTLENLYRAIDGSAKAEHNAHWKAAVRRTLQQSGEFVSFGPGVWALRPVARGPKPAKAKAAKKATKRKTKPAKKATKRKARKGR